MSVNSSYIVLLTLNIAHSDDIVLARQRARQITALLNFDVPDQTKIATVVSEISRNAYLYAGGGKIEYCISKNPLQQTFMVKISDKGPGIRDVSNILSGQFISNTGNGLGIIGSKRIMDAFVINTSVDQGTEVIAELNLSKNFPLITPAILATISDELAKNRPPPVSEEIQQQNQELLQALNSLSKTRDDLEVRVEERTLQLALANENLQQEISERKRIEEWMQQHQQELARAERINAMGELASTLAHELNQPLATITTYTQGCIRHLKNKDYKIEEILKIMNLVAAQSKRAGEVIHRMKNFVKQGELLKNKANINQVIKDTILLLQHEIEKYQGTIKFELSHSLPSILMDTIQIQQVITNLIRNALQAMNEAQTLKPTISIKAAVTHRDEIKVDIIDNGPGISVKTLESVLEPYFTTKKNGMGIGLSISRTIIEAHGGKLIVRNNPEGGAWFEFTLQK